MLSPEEEKQLESHRSDGLTTDDELREARRLLEQSHRVGWSISVADALARAREALAKAPEDAAVADDDEGDSGGGIEASDLRLLEKIGRGSQAVVYRCRQASTGRIFAVKILAAALARDREMRNRFIREGRHAAQIVHPNIVRIFQVAPFKNTLFIAMEYVAGGSVARLLAGHKRLTARHASRIIMPVARGLAYAHELGFIHRDIKPGNILLTEDGVPKLADMGLARRGADFDTAFQEVGKAFGTPYYISPEQVQGDPGTDHRTDIYSLGATFFEMLTGRPVFVAPDPKQILQMHLSSPVPDPQQLVPDLPGPLCRLLLKSLEKRPEDRYRSMKSFIAALDLTGLADP